MAADAFGTGEAALGAAALRAPRNLETGASPDRSSQIEIMAVERQSRLEPQRVARAETDRLDLGFRGRAAEAICSASVGVGIEISNPSSPV